MRILLQRVKRAKVSIKGKVCGEISTGLLLYVGFGISDVEKDVDYLVEKVTNFRCLPDENDKMNLSIKDVGGQVLIISQFTLYGDCRKGRRPSFTGSLHPEKAIPLYELFIEKCKVVLGEEKIATGQFGAMMEIDSINDGPINFILESV